MRELDEKSRRNEEAGWIESFRNNRKLKTKLSEFKVKYYQTNK